MKNLIAISICLLTLLFAASPDDIQKIPNITLKMLDGKKMTLNELLKDGPVLIDFWATWCAPCKKEMIHLETFHQRYKEAGFKVICISTDSPKSMSKVKSYIRAKKHTFFVALDPNRQIAQQLNAVLMPTSMILNVKREVLWFHQGYIPGDEKEIEKQIRTALNLDSEPVNE